MKRWLRNQSLSLFFIVFFLLTWIAQAVTGEKVYNDEMQEKGGSQVTFSEYLLTGHFFESTFENWESEFLQMALFVVVSAFLFQKGSSESKDPDQKEKPSPIDPKKAPWPVKKGGWILKLYEHSLSLALALLFLLSFLLHFYGSLKNYNYERQLQHLPGIGLGKYLVSSKFWFESFQNWQSEFLSVFAIIILSIFLREKDSPQSKPIESPDNKTGDQ